MLDETEQAERRTEAGSEQKDLARAQFQDQIARIWNALKIDSWSGLAKALGKKQATISSAKKRKEIPQGWLLTLNQKYGFSIKWILTGTGPMKVEQSLSDMGTYFATDFAADDPRRMAAAVQQAPGRKAASHSTQDQAEVMLESPDLDLNPLPSPTIESHGFKISQMLAMTARVLESGTTYAVALAYNIQHFDRAITAESRIDKLQQTVQSQGQTISNQAGVIRELQDECISVRKEVEELKSQLARLLATGGDSPDPDHGQEVA